MNMMIEAGKDNSYHCNGCIIALGTFDGVHLAHRVLLQRSVALAKQTGLPAVVYTFANHPLELIAPQSVPPLLTTAGQKREIMEQIGIDVLCAVPFTTEMMNLPPEVFVGEMVRRFHPKHVVCGYNYSFGAKGAGKPEMLMALGAALGFGCTVVPRIQADGMDISATQIRTAILEGNDRLANQLLGRPYAFTVQKTNDGFVMQNPNQLAPAIGLHKALFSVQGKKLPGLLKVVERQRMYPPKAFVMQSVLGCEILGSLSE